MGAIEELTDAVNKLNKKIEKLPAAAVGEGDTELAADGGKATLTAKELAEVLNVSRNTIYEQSQQGRLPFIKIGSKRLYPKPAIKKWLMEESANNYIREKGLDTEDITLTG